MQKTAELITNIAFENGCFYFKGDPDHKKIDTVQAEAIVSAMDEVGYFVTERAARDLRRPNIH